ncbi:hypothetical protein [Streptomyces subrutilus]|uniref:hypothetical protein n=1 Tax=Streptomyces subrutilus TaxID=36818 RepID=UPI002E12670E|nr:hypothetical protein OG479_23745 [Streptomyces subrutilus]
MVDEVPWLVEQDGEFEGALQTVWDRHLSTKPVLLILAGSDMSVMEALQSYGHPFFGRAAKMTVQPLHLADVQAMPGLDAAEAVGALLITGGFTEIAPVLAAGDGPQRLPARGCQLACAAAGGGRTVAAGGVSRDIDRMLRTFRTSKPVCVAVR